MKTVSIDQAQEAFETLIGEVAAGKIVEITVDGRPVARLVPASSAGDYEPIPGHEVEEAFHGD